MKKRSLISLVAVLCAGMAAPSWAVLIKGGPHNMVDPGGIDTYLGEQASRNAQDQADFINSSLGTSLTKSDIDALKNGTVLWYNTDTTDVIAFQLLLGPGSYLIKNANLMVLFTNVSDFDWGVIDLDDIHGDINLGGDMTISHVTEVGSPDTSVPEPGSLALVGAGLLGLGLVRRRKSAAKA